jgi:hypothetical protein
MFVNFRFRLFTPPSRRLSEVIAQPFWEILEKFGVSNGVPTGGVRASALVVAVSPFSHVGNGDFKV